MRTAKRRARTGIWAALAVAMLAGCGPNYEALANFGSASGPVVCFGDSITRGYGATAGGDYPSKLSALLGVPVVNAGRDGDTTATALQRLEAEVLRLKPGLVIVELGGNDRLNKVPVTETLANLDRIVAACTNAGAMVVLVHVKLGLWSDPYWEGFERIAEERDVLVVKNVLRGILANPKRMSDQIHPNNDGYALLAERVAEVVEPLLEAANER